MNSGQPPMMPKARQVGVGGEDIAHRLDALGAVVVGEHRATGDFGPAAFAVERGEAFLAGKRVTHTLRTAQDVVGGGVAFDGADLAAFGRCCLDVVADALAHQVVVGAEVGLAQPGVFLGKVGVDAS